MRVSYMLLTGLMLAIAANATAMDERAIIKGEDLRDIISDNTVTGRHDTGMAYSEWHAPDGRVYGHNNYVINEEACWDIRGDAVCYYYAGGASRGTFCWSFTRISDTGFRLKSLESGVGAAGLLQKGNPYNFDDNGKPWKCEPLSSQNMTPRNEPLAPATRHVGR